MPDNRGQGTVCAVMARADNARLAPAHPAPEAYRPNYTVRYGATCLAFLIALHSLARGQSGPVRQPNATFNNSGKDERLYGIWIREVPGSCEEQRRPGNPPLCLAVLPHGPGKYKLKDMKYCFRLTEGEPIDRCDKGVLKVREWDLSRRIVGEYDFTLQSGKRLKGGFEGVFCPPAEVGSHPESGK